MLFEKWDVDHIGIAVNDLDVAMSEYSAALEVEWKTVFEFTAEQAALFGSDTGVSIEGLRACGSLPRADMKPGSRPPVMLELVHAPPSSPAFKYWGCPDGRNYVHHVAYLVDDVDAESARILGLGFKRDWYTEDEHGRVFEAYHQSAVTGMRIQLVPAPKNAPNRLTVIDVALAAKAARGDASPTGR